MSSHLIKSLKLNIFFKYLNLGLSIFSGILMVPFYLRYMSVSDYGAWVAIGGFATWFAAMDPGLANLLIQKTSRSLAEENRRDLSSYISSGLVLSLAVSLLVVLVGYMLVDTLLAWMAITVIAHDLLREAFCLALLATAAMIMSYAVIGVLQGLHHSIAAGALVAFSNIAKIVIALVLFMRGDGFLSLPMAWALGSLATLLLSVAILLFSLRKMLIGLTLNGRKFREFFVLFTYSFGGRLAKVITGSIDAILIAKALGPAAVGAYALTATVPRQSENLVNQPVASFRPTLSHLSATHDQARLALTVVRLMSLLTWLGGWIALCLICANETFVGLWVGGHAFAGPEVSMALALLFFMRIWTNSTGTVGFSLGLIKSNSVMEWLYSILLVPALIIGLAWGGLLGVVCAHLLVQALTMGWYFPWTLCRHLDITGKVLAGYARQAMLVLLAGLLVLFVESLVVDKVGSWLELVLMVLAASVIYFGILFSFSALFRSFSASRSLAWLVSPAEVQS